MVFQNYALYPHMTVRENLSFSPKNIGMPRAQIDERVHAAALGGYVRPVGLDNYVSLFNDKIFLRSVVNTCYFVVLTTPAFVALGLFLALALNDS
jgi:ABC-type sugar transport system permease subunit